MTGFYGFSFLHIDCCRVKLLFSDIQDLLCLHLGLTCKDRNLYTTTQANIFIRTRTHTRTHTRTQHTQRHSFSFSVCLSVSVSVYEHLFLSLPPSLSLSPSLTAGLFVSLWHQLLSNIVVLDSI